MLFNQIHHGRSLSLAHQLMLWGINFRVFRIRCRKVRVPIRVGKTLLGRGRSQYLSMKLFMVKVFTQFGREEKIAKLSLSSKVLVYASVLRDYARQLMKRKTSPSELGWLTLLAFFCCFVHESTTLLKTLVSRHASEHLSEL